MLVGHLASGAAGRLTVCAFARAELVDTG